jgi:hypothetical protein
MSITDNNIDDRYDYDDIDYTEPLHPRDKQVDIAKDELKNFFKEHAEEVFYLKQLEVRFENTYYHWITAKAINELIREGYLGCTEKPLGEKTRVKFVFAKSYRYYRRQLNEMLKIIKQYSNPEIAFACGRQAEVLFLNALAHRGFLSHGENINEFKGKKWIKTKHNLDFIVERDNIAYGCEVKNRFDYIDRDEMRTKLEICEFLGIKPMFIMRSSPTSYNYEIIQKGGYAMIFVCQIYSFGSSGLVKKITEKLGMPVDCPKAIPNGIIERFMKNFHEKKKTM